MEFVLVAVVGAIVGAIVTAIAFSIWSFNAMGDL